MKNKIICKTRYNHITGFHYLNITVGKIYDVIYHRPDGSYKIIGDDGKEELMYSSLFRGLTRAEWRDVKLTELGV